MHHVVPPAMPPLMPVMQGEAAPAPEAPRSDRAASSTHASRPITDGALTWTVHSAADDPFRAALLVGVLAVASALAFEYSGSALLGIFGFLLLALSLRSWFLPRHYTLDGDGAGETGPLCKTRRLAWTEVRRVGRGRFGIYLSTLHSRSRFVRDRGLFLRTTGMRPSAPTPPRTIDRDAVLRFVDEAVKAS